MELDPVSNLIRSRRTVKPEDFSGERIEDEKIEEILENARWAPTHGYTEPWRFWIYCDEGLPVFGKLHADLYKTHCPIESYSEKKYDKLLRRTEKTSHLIVLGMERGSNPKIPAIEELAAASCAVQNMLLTVTAMGLVAYWGSGGMTHHPAMKAEFGLDNEEDRILGMLFLGVPQKPTGKGKRTKSISEKSLWIRN